MSSFCVCERERQRETETQIETHTHTQREREREREREFYKLHFKRNVFTGNKRRDWRPRIAWNEG